MSSALAHHLRIFDQRFWGILDGVARGAIELI
jgi:hypothetical protein